MKLTYVIAIGLICGGCNKPCGEDATPAKDGEISERFKELGVPPGGTMCMMKSGDLDLSSINYKDTTPDQGDAKFAEFMASKGWNKLELTPAMKKKEFDDALRGCLGDKHQLFGKEGSKERWYSTSSHCWKMGNVTGVYKVSCEKPKPFEEDYCDTK